MVVLANSNLRVLAEVASLDYFDTQSAELAREIGPVEMWNAIMAHPQPLLKLAFKIRDAVSVPFGVRSIKGFSDGQARDLKVGDYLDFFLVEYIDPETLVLTERDKHLDVMTCVSAKGATVAITSSVRVHNWFGRLYMIPVGIAHKWIVRGMLKRLQKQMSE